MIHKSSLTLYIFLFCISLLSVTEVSAQETKIFEIKNGSIINSGNNAKTIPTQLLYSLKATIYVKNNSVLKVTGSQNPLVLKTYDASSLNILKTKNTLFNKVQIIKIQLNEVSDLNSSIDFSTISDFNNLSHIYIISYFKCRKSQIRAFIRNVNPEITVYFENVNPS
ncbi:hypothetical protein [Mariniflexile sp. AS56]|uniref:hypothetical protein n=1 Tax=Mariniflexile sp. AS56 TaxID=3063957 RepID=UPI0026F215B7|nr:hypothetical protein [Mariniflexile sp. AS56]MDO7173608.1 hypothetical protein [Mariniflexile sp. AS56]